MAIITALEREAALHKQRSASDRRGDSSPPLQDPELLGRIATVVADFSDPASVPALASALGSGFTVIRALAAFGEQAAASVLAVVSSSDSGTDAVNHGLITLRLLVENSQTRPLRDATISSIRRATEQRLRTGKGLAVTTLWWAIDLAAVLNDAQLRHSVERLATDWNEAIARGITDPQLVEQTRKRAADRLAGRPCRANDRCKLFGSA
jgi:hypothetical protein